MAVGVPPARGARPSRGRCRGPWRAAIRRDRGRRAARRGAGRVPEGYRGGGRERGGERGVGGGEWWARRVGRRGGLAGPRPGRRRVLAARDRVAPPVLWLSGL